MRDHVYHFGRGTHKLKVNQITLVLYFWVNLFFWIGGCDPIVPYQESAPSSIQLQSPLTLNSYVNSGSNQERWPGMELLVAKPEITVRI